MKRISNLIALTLLTVSAPAFAQDAPPPEAPPAEPAPDAAAAPADAAAGDTTPAEPGLDATAPPAEAEPMPEEERQPYGLPPDEPAATASASAETSDDEPIYRKGGLLGAGIVVAPKFGVAFGQVFSDFGTAPILELELGWIVLPFPDLQIFTSLQYTNPNQSGEGTDARLPGETWTYELKQQSLVLTPGLLYRIPVGGKWFRPYLAAAPRFYFNKTVINGEAGGEAFGEYVEKGSSIGFYGAVGGDLFVGPGSILLEVQMATSKIDQYVLQDTNNGALNLALGYRFYF